MQKLCSKLFQLVGLSSTMPTKNKIEANDHVPNLTNFIPLDIKKFPYVYWLIMKL